MGSESFSRAGRGSRSFILPSSIPWPECPCCSRSMGPLSQEAVSDADTTQCCCWQNASLGKAQICTAFGEKEDAFECQEKWHCQIDGKLTALMHICRWKGGKASREKRAQQRERDSGRGVQQPAHRLDSLHQPQRDSFLDANVGSQSN